MTAIPTRTFARQPARRRRPARFDPLRVKIGVAVLLLTAFGFGALTSGATRSLDEVTVPVSTLCREGGPTAAQLAERGACAAADEAQQVGPYVVQGAAGDDGARGPAGETGPPGADSQVPGPPGADSTVPGSPGKAGEPGADSQVPGPAGPDGADGGSPACLSEPGQCRGAKGDPGADSTVAGPRGAKGDPGPTCPSGTSLQPVTFASGQEGLGCVKPAPSEEGMS